MRRGDEEAGRSVIVDKINAYLATQGQDVPQAIMERVQHLAGFAFQRQFGPARPRTADLYLSTIGRCLRAQAYAKLGATVHGKELDARSKMVFFQGDVVEIAIVQVAKLAGCAIHSEQITVELGGVVGHPDGVLGADTLVEVKSMSSYGFEEFQRGVLDEGYRYQINAYMAGLRLKQAVVVALNKDAGVLAEMVVPINPEIVADIHDRIKVLRAATLESLPERPHKPNDKGFYPWNCLYCAYHKTCLPNAEKVLVGKRYKLKEGKNVAAKTR